MNTRSKKHKSKSDPIGMNGYWIHKLCKEAKLFLEIYATNRSRFVYKKDNVRFDIFRTASWMNWKIIMDKFRSILNIK